RLDRSGIVALEPNVGPHYRVGLFLPHEATVVNPYRYVLAIVNAFVARGGTMLRDNIRALEADSVDGWIARGDDSKHAAEHGVIAAGIGSTRILRPLGLDLPLEAHRGYHVTFKGARAPVTRTVVLTDRRIYATPMEEGFRVGGMVEFGGVERPPNYEYCALL